MEEPVHNSVTAIATGKPLLPLLAHGDQETRQLAIMQLGQSGVMLVQALSTPGGPQ